MPRRWVSETICDSPNFNNLSSEAIDHWVRCLVQTDDYGCYQSTPAYLKGHCYPMKEVNLKDIQLRQQELEFVSIILPWKDNEREYSVFTTFPRFNYPQRRHSRKTPAPPQFVIDALLASWPDCWQKNGDPNPKGRHPETEEESPPPRPALRKATPSPEPEASDLPDWLPIPEWQAFLDMRKKVKAPPTEHGKDLLIQQLDKLRIAGDDPAEVLNQSIMQNWKGLFALKHPGKSDTHRPAQSSVPQGGVYADRYEEYVPEPETRTQYLAGKFRRNEPFTAEEAAEWEKERAERKAHAAKLKEKAKKKLNIE